MRKNNLKIDEKEDLLEGKYIHLDKEGWFHILNKGEKYVEPKYSCYFCAFDEVLHDHHIIRKNDGGFDDRDNLITLCPNHHYLIHKADYRLKFCKGYYLLIKGEIIIYPHESQKENLMNKPIRSIKNAIRLGKLRLEGDLNSNNCKLFIVIKKDGSSQ